MTQGTISILIGCHSPIHSILVLLSWKRLYKKWPKFWQIVCIFLHDIGHFGLNYLDSEKEKKEHWEKGAILSKKLFKEKGYFLVAGHCSASNFPESDLYKADKYSWYIAPVWWLFLNNIIEPKLKIGFKSNMEAVIDFKKQVKESIEKNKFVSTHSMYVKRKADAIK